jgi:cobalamin biosynthesis Co2+ chelatase CbiK
VNHLHSVYNTSQEYQYQIVDKYNSQIIHLIYKDATSVSFSSDEKAMHKMFMFGYDETAKQTYKITRITNGLHYDVINKINHLRVINELKQKFINQESN